jgi:histidyl-tRNA synthetase
MGVPMPRFQAPRGTRDLTPTLAAAFDAVGSALAERASRYGYARIETPPFEEAELFRKTTGETSDIVQYEMFDVSLRGEGGLVLRPEGTPPVVRAYLQAGLHRAPHPVRFFYLESMARGQRPQLARLRAFWQWGLECFGPAEPAADVEIVEFSHGYFMHAGLTEYELQLNTIGDAPCRPRVREALAAYFATRRDELCDDGRAALERNPLRILDHKDEACRVVAEGAPKIRDLVCDEDRAHFAAVRDGLERLGVPYVVNDRLVRGLDYYTRTVFEFSLTNPKFERGVSVAGGGRYDGLIELLGGPSTAGVGIAGGVEVLLLALEAQGTTAGKEPQPQVYVVSAETDDGVDRLQFATQLRAAGFRVAVDYSRRGLDRQLESAAKHGATVAIIRGTGEARGGNVIVRNLDTKEQRITKLAAVLAEVSRQLGIDKPRDSV